MSTVKTVPCNIITGFLGVGKTSAILNLLKNKPSNERWAVLVNEFGEIGIDGSLFEGQQTEEDPVYIREVPGGCMCCAAGLPMQVALNQLIARAKPDRLLIEPTGLGHPKEVMEVLSAEYYQEVLDIQKIITLVDARKLADSRYTEHETFNQQIAIADVVVGNKQDLYSEDEQQALMRYVAQHASVDVKVFFTEQGLLEKHWLQGSTTFNQPELNHHHHHASPKADINERTFPNCGYLSAANQGDGFNSIGWRFAGDKVFDFDKVSALIASLLDSCERIKATLKTTRGNVGLNITQDNQEEVALGKLVESRIEVIAAELPEDLEQQLLNCLRG